MTDEDYLRGNGWEPIGGETEMWREWRDPLCGNPGVDYSHPRRPAVAIQRGRDAAVEAERERVVGIVREVCGDWNNYAACIERRIKEGSK